MVTQLIFSQRLITLKVVGHIGINFGFNLKFMFAYYFTTTRTPEFDWDSQLQDTIALVVTLLTEHRDLFINVVMLVNHQFVRLNTPDLKVLVIFLYGRDIGI